MQKNIQPIVGILKKYYLVIIQATTLIVLLFAFMQTTINNRYVLNNYTIDKIGEFSTRSPEFLFRNFENQKIILFYQNNTLETQSLNIEIVLSQSDSPITFIDKNLHEIIPTITFSDVQPNEAIMKELLIITRDSSINGFAELLVEIKANGKIVNSDTLKIKVESQIQFLLRSALPYIIFFLVVSLTLTLFYQNYFIRRSETDNDLSQRLEIAEIKVDETPDKVKPIWDVARFTLEKYINRNQQQIDLIFALSLSVMLVSFAIIVVGVYIAIKYPDSFSIAILTTGVGVITEFIGTTFLIIYKSTLKQASDYSKTLERIATIGVAVQILDTLVDDPKTGNIKSKTKSEVVKLLIKNNVINNENGEGDNK